VRAPSVLVRAPSVLGLLRVPWRLMLYQQSYSLLEPMHCTSVAMRPCASKALARVFALTVVCT
jgi:hypothetical protein